MTITHCFKIIVILLLALFTMSTAKAKNSMRWISGAEVGCQVLADSFITNFFLRQGECENGLVNGKATIVYMVNEQIREVKTGYYKSGFYIGDQDIQGRLLYWNNEYIMRWNYTIAGHRFFSKMVYSNAGDALCSNEVYITHQRGYQHVDLGNAVPNFLNYYRSYCSDQADVDIIIYANGFYNYVYNEYLLKGKTIASFDGASWLIQNAMASNNTPMQTVLQPSVIGNSNISIQYNARIRKDVRNGQNVCYVELTLNNQTVDQTKPLNSSNLVFIVRSVQGQQLYRTFFSQSSKLATNDKIVMRNLLPSSSCGFVDNLALMQASCSIGNNKIINCVPYLLENIQL
jgi:hypothetical protein